MRILYTIRLDLATAIRTLRRNPGFAIAALAALAIGIGANTAILARFMTTLVYGVKPVDPVVICRGAAVLCAIAALAAYIPAHRASRLDAAEVLRSA